ncbi:hypothetical protein GXM_01220 [Nostoc sphaeroides CCNUC1]|uniref:Uncharacterized protein n=1 Tax=Nostoc sphaeroides CCNUC1 TaxID=2653204 RepID=A0A5P8VTP3_9NOSO|nr:hypothetical protein GXM_01220 [Nostoc sphaeroides CCNUC1]
MNGLARLSNSKFKICLEKFPSSGNPTGTPVHLSGEIRKRLAQLWTKFKIKCNRAMHFG